MPSRWWRLTATLPVAPASTNWDSVIQCSIFKSIEGMSIHPPPASGAVYASRRELVVIITETQRYVQEVHA